MKWIMVNGEAHVLIKEDEAIFTVACSTLDYVNTPGLEVKETNSLEARPFGVDTHDVCHQIVKDWHLHPEETPEGMITPVPAIVPDKPLSRKERDAAVQGLGRTDTGGDGPQVPPTPVAARPSQGRGHGENADDDDEAVPLPVTAGAVVVPPTSKAKQARRTAEDREFDSD